MRKYWKWILVVVSFLLVGLLAWFLFDYFSVPRLPPWEKEKVEQEYFEYWCMSDEKIYRQQPMIWYEENGYVEEHHVWRYVGTYGDCYAFLVIEDNIDGLGWPWEPPYPIEGLPRMVYYPTNEACIMLYHTKKEFTYEQVFMSNYESDSIIKMHLLSEIDNREEWLTDAQLEQLTQDIEKLAKAHN